MSGARVLVVEDDRRTAELVALYLRHDGHRVHVEHSGSDALARLEHERFDLLLLDVMLPGVDGLELCRRVRARHDTPVILMTARTLEEQRIEGLELGADDYVTKPFSPRELAARVRAVLRRAPPGTHEILTRGDLAIDRVRRTVEVGGRGVDLTPTELALLLTLAERPAQVFSRAQLLQCLPGGALDTLDRTVDVHIRNLRRKLDDDDAGESRIETVFGVGYRLHVRGTT